MQFSANPLRNLFKDDYSVFLDDENAINRFADRLCKSLPSLHTKEIVFVCIGTDRSTGDSLGPLVGTMLGELNLSKFHYYGTLDEPIHALNLSEQLEIIKGKYNNPFIIAVDACLGRVKSIGSVRLSNGPLKPGAAMKKELPLVGEINLTGVVNVSGFMEFYVLQNTRLSLVMKMAKFIATSIKETERKFTRQLDY
ncbi:spore protease YyaC [Bacillus sp. AFS055030]|uniref:spore protease YyaC n=1 Tax=Bacillus sp. AFS055030 TaxID=2033507 RepID=UPI000BFC98CE|nr:spore protease YyaC [Bacillus sp. AFS055030]PGL72814.1 spore protease YyaC [Bacillus sp. AFS055030]